MTDFYLLEDAQNFVKDNVREGVECPCCNQFAKKYKRNISGLMAKCLIRIYRLTMDTNSIWHPIEDFYLIGKSVCTNYSLLRHWGLIEEMANKDPSKKSSGSWRITHVGKRFVNGEYSVSKYAWLYNGHLNGFSGDMIKISDCIQRFDYRVLMGWEEK